MSQASRPLVLCADDFALNESTSQAIARLAQAGRISAASVMSLSPRWPQDQALLRNLAGSIDVGLHLDWTSDFAKAAGHGVSLGAAMREAIIGGFDVQHAKQVIARQLDLFEAHWKRAPDYVDGHQHVHQFAGIRDALVELLSQRYGTLTQAPYVRIAQVHAPGLKSWIITWMGAKPLAKRLGSAGFAHSAVLSGVYDFKGSQARYADLMRDWLQQAPAHSIVMCHPAVKAESGDAIGRARTQEFAYLSGPEFAQALQHSGVQVARGSHLFGAHN